MIEIYRGDSDDLEITLLDDNGDPVPLLTGDIMMFTAKEKYADTDEEAAIAKDVTIDEDIPSGKVIIPLTKDDTDLSLGEYYCDAQRVRGNDVKTIKLDDGKLKIHNDVTKRTAPLS